MTISLSFPDSTYTTSNKPSANTLKADLSHIEQEYNAHEASTTNPHSVTAAQVGALTSADLLDEDDMASDSTSYPASQQSIKAYVDSQLSSAVASAKAALFPVGSIYTAIVSTNPATLLGFGTWTAFGAGRVIVGHNASDTAFDTAEETGGAKTHALSIAELAAHNHGGATGWQSANHTHTLENHIGGPSGSGWSWAGQNSTISGAQSGGTSNDHTHSVASQGSGAAHNNLQPYIVAYMWKRTA